MAEETNINWKKINCKLSKYTLNALKGLKFESPTPIQRHVIPTFLKKKDIVAEAVTGSGKTLAFIIPIMELYSKMDSIKSSDVFSIILSPTTELANQTYEMFNDFLKHFEGQKPNLKLFTKKVVPAESTTCKGTIIISTPGGFAKAIEKNVENATLLKSLKTAEILILDEADRLLEMGFEDQLITIIKSLPKQRLTALFSATQTTEVEDLIRAGLRNPVRVSVKMNQGEVSEFNDNMPKNMTNYYMEINNENKIDVLIKFLSDKSDKKILVFLATCSCVDYYKNILSMILKKHKFVAFHKKLKNKRSKIFEQFKKMKSGIMLCTDVMARGIDIPEIDWVIQFDPPKAATNFVHRCGRTARCDLFGETLILLRSTEDTYLHFLRENQNIQMQEYKPEFNLKEIDSYETKMQNLCKDDRLLYEKSIKAYVSYVMYYKKHELKYIFKWTDLNMGKLANSFGLLRVPQMAELKGVDLSDFHDTEVDLKSLIYKDKSVRIVRAKTRIIKKERREAEAMEVEEEEDQHNKKSNDVKNKNNKMHKKINTTEVEAMDVEQPVEKVKKTLKTKPVFKSDSKPQKRKVNTSSNQEKHSKKSKIARNTDNLKESTNQNNSSEVKTVTKKVVGKGIMASFNKAEK